VAKQFSGKISLDIRDSVPDWDAFLPGKAPHGARNGGDAVSSAYTPKFAFIGGRIVKVVVDIADDLYVDVEKHLEAAMARD